MVIGVVYLKTMVDHSSSHAERFVAMTSNSTVSGFSGLEMYRVNASGIVAFEFTGNTN